MFEEDGDVNDDLIMQNKVMQQMIWHKNHTVLLQTEGQSSI